MADITSAVLGAINNGLNLAYNTQLYAATADMTDFVFDAQSTGAAEVYPTLSTLQGVREWIGAREVQALSQSSFSITNRTFEETVAIKRENIEDDKYGMFSVVAGQLGRDANQLPPTLIGQLMTSGFTAPGPDGTTFFGSGHVNYTNKGVRTTTSNFAVVTGTGAVQGPPWFLIDSSQLLKPFIHQKRRPFVLTTRFNLQDPTVFDNNEFVWGVDGRMNVGYGLWQLAYASTQPLTQANLIAAKTAMSQIRRPNGTPMGIKPNILVVPTALWPTAQSLYLDSLIANDPTTPTTLVANQVKGAFKPSEFQWLN